jgi:hypothetical protein
MKKIITFNIIVLLTAIPLFANNSITRYYTHLKTVTKDRKELKGNASGQFITFNEKGCYGLTSKTLSLYNR